MRYKDYKLKTVFKMKYELKDQLLGGKKITRNINGLNVTMHFKKGVCKVTINNIIKINHMSQIDKDCREIDFERVLVDDIYREVSIDKLRSVLNTLEDKIRLKYYDLNTEVVEFSEDIHTCGVVTIA